MTFFFLLFLTFLSTHTDEGPGMCPVGGRSATLDHRCTIDPNGSGCIGGLTSASDTDGRSVIDPIG